MARIEHIYLPTSSTDHGFLSDEFDLDLMDQVIKVSPGELTGVHVYILRGPINVGSLVGPL